MKVNAHSTDDDIVTAKELEAALCFLVCFEFGDTDVLHWHNTDWHIWQLRMLSGSCTVFLKLNEISKSAHTSIRTGDKLFVQCRSKFF